MSTIRVVWGTASGPTRMSSYDAALADANVHNYNLVAVSSVIPADATVEAVGTAPDLGPAGNELTVVQAHADTAGPGRVSAALAWAARGDEPGLFYEAAGETSPDDVEAQVTAGIEAGLELRDWSADGPEVRSVTVEADPGEYAAAVVVAAYGDSDPLL